MSDTASAPEGAVIDDKERRDFLMVSTAVLGAAGTSLAIKPLLTKRNAQCARGGST